VLFVGVSTQSAAGAGFLVGEFGFGPRMGYPFGVLVARSWTPGLAHSDHRTADALRRGSLKLALSLHHVVILGQMHLLHGGDVMNLSVSLGHGF